MRILWGPYILTFTSYLLTHFSLLFKLCWLITLLYIPFKFIQVSQISSQASCGKAQRNRSQT